MLKNVPHVLSPALLKILCEMGHGDTIVLADANFPAQSYAARMQVVRCDGLGIPQLLDAILQFFPLDRYIPQPVTLMDTQPGEQVDTSIWHEYDLLIHKYEKHLANGIRHM